MAYTFKFVIGKKTLLFPVPPSTMNINIKNQNKTVSLINGKEINILSSPGLKEIEFEAMLPRADYPFAAYQDDINGELKKVLSKLTIGSNEILKKALLRLNGGQNASKFLIELEKLKTNKKSFQFIILRETPRGVKLGDTNITVSLEEYGIKEDAENGLDVMVSIRLKEYRVYGTKTYKKKVVKPKNNRVAQVKKPKTYKVVKGDTLSKIAKKYLGDSSRYMEIAKLNKISNPNLIYVGQVIKLP